MEAKTTNPTAATAFATPRTRFFIAFPRGRVSPVPSRYIASMSDAGGGAEVAAVDGDGERAQRAATGGSRWTGWSRRRLLGQLARRPLDEDRGRGAGDEERHDPLEGAGRREQQQHRPGRPAEHGGDGQRHEAAAPGRASSGREALTEPTLLSTSATVLVTLAVTGGRPIAEQRRDS